MGIIFGKAFRIFGLDEREGRWAVKQDFHGNFRVNVVIVVCFFLLSSQLNCAYSGMDEKITSPCTS